MTPRYNAGQGIGVTVNDVLRDPRAYVGKTVTVDGTVAKVISFTSFTLTSANAAAGGGGSAMLVAGASGAVPSLTAGNQVRVTGVVRCSR